MGWSSGSVVMGGVIDAIKDRVKDIKTRQEIYREMIVVLEDQDWDTQDECIGEDEAFDSAFRQIHPDWDI